MLLNLDANFHEQIVSMLKWLCFSTHVLRLYHLAEIFVLHPESPEILDESERLFNARDVLKYLGGFVVLGNTSKDDERFHTVFLAHFSIKEYLTSERISRSPASTFSFSEVEARFHIAYSCLAYFLRVPNWAESPSINMPLSYIAISEWIPHLEMLPVESWSVEAVDRVKRALTPRSPSLLRIVSSQIWKELRFGPYASRAVASQPLRACARLGLRQLTGIVISMAEYLTQEDLDAALQEAVSSRTVSTSLVELLLDHGANVNCKDGPPREPLLRPAREGLGEIVRLLVDRGADVNSRNMVVGTTNRPWAESPLAIAASEGQLDMVEFLLERGADVCNDHVCAVAWAVQPRSSQIIELLLSRTENSSCTHSSTLHRAVRAPVRAPVFESLRWHYRGRQVSRPEWLLEKGFDVNAWGGDEHGYPIHQSGSRRTDNLLLSRGADINAVGGKLGTALQAACSNGGNGKAYVEYLLKQGADLSIQGGDFGNALAAACYAWGVDSFHGWDRTIAKSNAGEIVPILLNHG